MLLAVSTLETFDLPLILLAAGMLKLAFISFGGGWVMVACWFALNAPAGKVSSNGIIRVSKLFAFIGLYSAPTNLDSSVIYYNGLAIHHLMPFLVLSPGPSGAANRVMLRREVCCELLPAENVNIHSIVGFGGMPPVESQAGTYCPDRGSAAKKAGAQAGFQFNGNWWAVLGLNQ